MGTVSNTTSPLANSEDVNTPRCVFTGAETFLEIAEEIDQDNTGLLHEDEFPRILSKCGVDISLDLLTGILSRFPRSSGKFIRYSDFLHRFGQNPLRTRARRELKQLLHHLHARLNVPTSEWVKFLRHRFEKYDNKLHGVLKRTLPPEVFLRTVQGRSSVLKLSTEEAAQVTSQFLRASNSSTSRVHYLEFLQFVHENRRIPNIDTTVKTPTSPKAAKLPLPEPATSAPTDEIDTSNMAVGDSQGVGDYLMYHASFHERRNFEKLMEMLQNFQATTDDEATIQRVADGIMLPLGPRLRVKVQFSMND
ncbi:hypothetical protein PHMEG_00015809 [Phytophthora megakarya]|uniref:EF-hand domain-containing protein n=1 Tax=Phytophthora megakarya TaxID=4795 RepID=A0A225W0I2_9STRA|nr:hypothetical protein PHMEG_00015809 [Phytophthora megakarya]